MIQVKDRPKHLSVRPKSIRKDYPQEDFCLENVVMIAELDDRNIEFDITLLYSCDRRVGEVVIVGEVPIQPKEGTAYIVGDKNILIAKIGNQMEVIRRSQKSDALIVDWLLQRVGEYVNSRIL